MYIQWIILIPSILLAITVHEYSHGWVAYKRGDFTAHDMGRLTFNPFLHLDFIGTFVMVITSIAGYPFGWAKPVPVNPYNLKDPKRDMVLVSLAGPLSNFFLAVVFGLSLRFFEPNLNEASVTMFLFIMVINLGLGLFNLIPVPPLDGSKILIGLLPDELANRFASVNPIIFLVILMLMLSTGIASIILSPVFKFLVKLIVGKGLFF